MIGTPKQKREANKEYRKYVESCPCVVGFDCLGDIISHHTKSVGSGGSDFSCIPLCMKHHNEIHNTGSKTFQAKYCLYFKDVIVKLLIGYVKKLNQR